MNDSELTHFSRIFKALADEARQRILELFRKNGEMAVNDISSHFKLSQPTISQHLKVLKDVEAWKVRKDGQPVFDRICNIQMYDAMEAFMETY
jgi:ArsR family transcriptional regulator, repressor of sdpIR and other operons